MTETPPLRQALQDSVATGQAAEARRAAHTLKSDAATTLAALCQQAETLGQDGGVQLIQPLIAEIAAECTRVRSALDDLHRQLAC